MRYTVIAINGQNLTITKNHLPLTPMYTNQNKPRFTDQEAVAHCLTIENIPLREAVARTLGWDNNNMPMTYAMGNCNQHPDWQSFPLRIHLVQALIDAGYSEQAAERRITKNYDTMISGVRNEQDNPRTNPATP